MKSEYANLPEPIRTVIDRVVERGRLSPERKVDLRRELATHFMDGLDRGHTAAELLKAFGDPATAGELIRRWGRGRSPLGSARHRGAMTRWVAGLGRDVRYAVRGMGKSPGFTALAGGILALGVGAAGAIFGVVHGILLDPLPYPDSGRLVNVWQTNPEWESSPLPFLREMAISFPASWPILQDWDRSAPSLSAVGGYSYENLTLSGGAGPERVRAYYVTTGIFEALGVPAMRGRYVTRADDTAGGPPVVVLSHELWRRHFNKRPDMVGSTIQLDGAPVTVIGIMPPGFGFPRNEGLLWLPFEDADRQRHRGSQFITAVGRLTPGAKLETVQAELDVIAAAQRAELDEEYGARVEYRLADMVEPVRPAIMLLSLTVAVVLLIACVNLANLLLVRGTERQGEFAVRSALGANPATLRRQMVVEGVLLGVGGGLVGILLAAAVIGPLRQLIPGTIPRTDNIGLSWPVLLASLSAGVGTALLASLIPTIRLGRFDLAGWLREGSRGTAGRERHRIRAGFVVTQVAAAFVLVAGAGVFLRSFERLVNLDPGFPIDRLAVVDILAPDFLFPEDDDVTRFHEQLVQRLQAVPGISLVASSSNLPFAGGRSATTVNVLTPEVVEDVRVLRHAVGGRFFETMGMTVLSGRALDARDRGEPASIVINRTGQEEFWPGGTAIGQRFLINQQEYTVVGVVSDVSPGSLTEEIQPTVYFTIAQSDGRGRRQSYVLRGALPDGWLTDLRAAVDEVNPMVPVGRAVSMDELVAESVAEPRFRTVLIGWLAALAAGLALVGIYGIVAYTVVRRTREIGIRMALGARRESIVARVLRGVLGVVALGLVSGAVIIAMTFGALEQFLYDVVPLDPVALSLAAGAMVAVALGAAWLPARRASRLDPVTVLRAD